MPNHVRNILTFNASDEEINEILNAIKDDEKGIGSIDFNKLIPMPEELNLEKGGSLNKGCKMFFDFAERANKVIDILKSEDKTFDEFKEARFMQKELLKELEGMSDEDKQLFELGRQYTENVNTYGYGDWYDWSRANWGTKWNAYNFEHYGNTIEFFTANEAPNPIIKYISEQYPNVEIIHQWADANWGHNLAVQQYKNGEILCQYLPVEGSVEAYDMAFKIWNTTPKDCGYALNPDGDGYISTEESATLSSFEFADEDNDELEL